MAWNMGIALGADLGSLPALPRISAIVVPADTVNLVTEVTPTVSVGTFVDTIFAPELNSVVLGSSIVRKTSSVNRSIYLCSRTSTAVASAPAAVQALVTTLAASSEQSFALYSTIGGDVWIVGNSVVALRHGAYEFIDRVGIRYLAPNPAWRINSTRGSLELVANEVMSPVVKSFIWNGNGGLGDPSLPVGLPGRAAAVAAWDAWKQQTRNPIEIGSGYGDGDAGFTADRYQELDGDHSKLSRTSSISSVTQVGAGPVIVAGIAVVRVPAIDGTYVVTISTGGANNGTAQYTFTFNGGSASSPAALPAVPFQLPGYPQITLIPPVGSYTTATTYTYVASTKRGFSETGAYPTGLCAKMPVTLAKLCATHTGASGLGSYPAAPAGPSPWVGLAAAAWHETCVVNPPGGAITPDPGPDTATNPSPNYTAFGGLVALWANHKVYNAAEQLNTYGAPHPYTRCVSGEPNDGVYFCFCTNCINILRNGPYSAYLTTLQKTQDASDSDKLYYLVNEGAKYMTYMYQNARDANGNTYVPMIGVLGYTTHTEPPSIPIQPNTLTVVLVSTAPYVGTLPSELIPKWSVKRAGNALGQFMLGAAVLWLDDTTNFSRPAWPSPKQGALYLQDWISKGCTAFNAQTGFSALIQALQIRLMSALCWRPTLDIDGFINEEFTLAYGPAASAARALYDRWWYWFENSPQSVAIGMAAMQSVQAALDAAPDPVQPDGRANVQRRVNHLKGLLEWERRYTEYFAARSDYDNGKLTLGGGAVAAVILTGNRGTGVNAPSVIRIEIDGNGGAGVGTFKWTKNADAATTVWEQTAQPIPAVGSPVALGTTGRTATFPTATYTIAQSWTEVPNVTALLAAADRVFSWAWRMSSTNGINGIRYQAGPTNGRIYNATPHPVSSSNAGTAPPTLTVQALLDAGISPTNGTSYVELQCTLGGALGTATLQYRVNGGAWNGFTTPALSTTAVTLALAGIKITCAAGPYNTNNLWYLTIAPQLSKWDWTNSAAPADGAGWAGMTEPTTSDMNTLVASGVAAYTPLAGVTRKVFVDTSFRPFNISASTTLATGPAMQFPCKYVVNTPANPTTIKLQTSGLSATTQGVPVRAVLKSMAGVTLQEWFFTAPLAPGISTNDLVITQPPGLYQLFTVDSIQSFSASRLLAPQNVGCVLVNEWFDAPAAPAIAYDQTRPLYFYGPDPSETKICGVFTQLFAPNVPLVQLYDPTGTPATMTYSAPSQFSCPVGGYNNQPWSLTGWAALDLKRIVNFENCPNRFAFSPYQLLIP